MHKNTFYDGNKEIIDFYHKFPKNKKELSVMPSNVKSYQKLANFFQTQPPKISIYFIYTRPEMDKHWGEPSGCISAMVDSDSIYTIYIFSPLVFEKLTSHKISDMTPIIVHEIAHTFVSQINENCSSIINEGICLCLENGEEEPNIIDKKNWDWFRKNDVLLDAKISWRRIINYQGYRIAYHLVKYLLKKYNKQIVIDLLSVSRDDSKLFAKKFNEILGGDIVKFLDAFEKNLSIK